MNESYSVYILRCCDGSYYIGSSSNLQQRIAEHNSGKAARWTAQRLPVTLVYSEPQENLISAYRRERQIKGWTRSKKENLITGKWSRQNMPG